MDLSELRPDNPKTDRETKKVDKRTTKRTTKKVKSIKKPTTMRVTSMAEYLRKVFILFYPQSRTGKVPYIRLL